MGIWRISKTKQTYFSNYQQKNDGFLLTLLLKCHVGKEQIHFEVVFSDVKNNY